jgi:hypothetical protein
MNLYEWAARHGVGIAAVIDLQQQMGLEGSKALGLPQPPEGKSEAWVSSLLDLEASQVGGRLWRNNVGAWTERDENTGRVIRVQRYGLANASKQMNEMLKSADKIGLRPRLITPDMVGSTIGQFLSREAKAPGWKFNPNDPHEVAQKNWADLIVSLGGDAGFASSGGTIK